MQRLLSEYPDTSLQTYRRLKDCGELSKRRKEVLEVILEKGGGRAASFQVAEWLGLPLHSVSGRITELNNMGYLVDSGDRREKQTGGIRSSYIVWSWAYDRQKK